eukprot:29278_1
MASLQWTHETVLIVLSGLLTLLSLPQLIIGITKICKMRKLELPKSVFWTCLLSLFFAYSVIASIFLLSTFITFIYPPSRAHPNHSNAYTSYLVDTTTQIGSVLPIGISVIEFLFISSKTAVNLLFLCRLYFSFKCTMFQYSIRQLSPLFILIIIELIIYLLFSDIILVHIPHKYHLHRTFSEPNLNKIFLTAYHCLEVLIRVTFILLFERGLYRLATSRSLRSNLRLFGFGGKSIEQIELSCAHNADVITPLKTQITPKPIQNEQREKTPQKRDKSRSNSNNTLHPLSYQNTERDDNGRFDLTSFPIPEGLECKSVQINDENGFQFIPNCPTDDDDAENNSYSSDSDKHKSNVSAPRKTKAGHVLCHSNDQPSLSIEQSSTRTQHHHKHGRRSSQIDDMLSMSQMGSDVNRRSSFAVKYLNESTFDSQTLDLVTIVTKFSVLVVWSTVISTLAAVFWISFVLGFGNNEIIQNITSSYIAVVICFVEMHVVLLQLRGLEKWYNCLCGCCHNTWRKCCICKLRCRLVRKIGKQHKEMTQKEAEKRNKKRGNE